MFTKANNWGGENSGKNIFYLFLSFLRVTFRLFLFHALNLSWSLFDYLSVCLSVFACVCLCVRVCICLSLFVCSLDSHSLTLSLTPPSPYYLPLRHSLSPHPFKTNRQNKPPERAALLHRLPRHLNESPPCMFTRSRDINASTHGQI